MCAAGPSLIVVAAAQTAAGGEFIEDSLTSLGQDLGLSLSHRSTHPFARVVRPALVGAGMDEDTALEWAKALAGCFLAKDGNVDDDASLPQPVVLGQQECELLAEIGASMQSAGIGNGDVRGVFESSNKAATAGVSDQVNALRALASHSGFDGAMFGRFATGVAVRNVDSCVEVAHSFTVHPIQSVADFFSAQDTLQERDETGAGHIGTAELCSSLFYQYAVINMNLLERNFAGLDDSGRVDLAAWLVRALARVEPAAKRGSTAPHSTLEELVVEVGPRQPLSLAAAFRKAIRASAGEDIGEAAREAMAERMKELDGIYGAPTNRFQLRDFITGEGAAIDSLSEAVADYLQSSSGPNAEAA